MSEDLREKLGRQILVKPGELHDNNSLKRVYCGLLVESFLLLVAALICRHFSKWKNNVPTQFIPKLNSWFWWGAVLAEFVFFVVLFSFIASAYDDEEQPGKWFLFFSFSFCGICLGCMVYEELLRRIVGGDVEVSDYSYMIICCASINVILFTYPLVDFFDKLKSSIGKFCISLVLTLLAVTICFFNDRGMTKALNLLSDGDVVIIGEYEQDGDSTNGAEEIRWKVLNVDDSGVVTLVSEACLELLPYDGVQSWMNSNLRRWLNEDFYERAFNSEEKQVITDDKHKVSIWKYYTASENGVWDDPIEFKDKVFLLDVEYFDDAEKKRIINEYSVSAKARRDYIDCYGNYDGAYYLCDVAYFVTERVFFPVYREEKMKAGTRCYYDFGVDNWEHGMLVRPVITVKLLGNYVYLKSCKVGQR